jgi:ribosomal protein S18 acetylase RimI-like enzyme
MPFRRRGIARDLIAAAERYFLDRKIRRVVVKTRLDRTNAHRFYETVGYTRTGFRFGKELVLPNEHSRQPTASSS